MSNHTYPFGRDKGKPLTEVSTESLNYYIGRADVNDPKWGAKNREIVKECERIIASRGGTQARQTNSGGGNNEVAKDVKAVLKILKQAYPEFADLPDDPETPF